jgi:hypothetical protein
MFSACAAQSSQFTFDYSLPYYSWFNLPLNTKFFFHATYRQLDKKKFLIYKAVCENCCSGEWQECKVKSNPFVER